MPDAVAVMPQEERRPAPTLDAWLGHCYAADQLNRGTVGDTIAAFRLWLGDEKQGPERKAEAQKRLTSLRPEITNRCFISKRNRSYLETALKD